MDIKQVVITKIGILFLCILSIVFMILALFYPSYATAYIIIEIISLFLIFILVGLFAYPYLKRTVSKLRTRKE